MRSAVAALAVVIGVAIFGDCNAAPQGAATPPGLGRYGLKPATIEAAQGRDIKDSDLFDPATQDALAKKLLEQAGMQEFRDGRLSGAEYQGRVARIWSSLEDPTAPGDSYFMKRNVDGHAKLSPAKASLPPYNRELKGSYIEWRDRLTALGWRPYLMKPSAECRLFYGMCERFPETIDCAQTGKSFCNFAFLDAHGRFLVVGIDADTDLEPSGSVVIAPAAASHLDEIRQRVVAPESEARLRAAGKRDVAGDYAAAKLRLIAQGLQPFPFKHAGAWDDCAPVDLKFCRANPETLGCHRDQAYDMSLCIYVFTDRRGAFTMAYQNGAPDGPLRLYPADAGDLVKIRNFGRPVDVGSTSRPPSRPPLKTTR